MEIRENRIGILTYTIQVNNQEGEVLEEATIDQPRTMLFGTGRLLKSFDEKLLGLRSGDRFEFVLSPDECFGAYQEELVMDLPKTAFMINGQLKPEALEIGRTVPMVDSDGNPFDGKVISVHTDTVRMDFNHPLAGKHLFTRALYCMSEKLPKKSLTHRLQAVDVAPAATVVAEVTEGSNTTQMVDVDADVVIARTKHTHANVDVTKAMPKCRPANADAEVEHKLKTIGQKEA